MGATQYCPTSQAVQATLAKNADGTWTYTRTLGGPTTFTFAAVDPSTGVGALTEKVDANQNSIQAGTYSPTAGQPSCPTVGISPDTCVAWTSSASGGVLVVATTTGGQIDRVFDPASGQTAEYAYSGASYGTQSCSSWTPGQPIDLCSVTDPAGVASFYTYDSANSTPYLQYDMTGFTPAGASGLAANAFNAAGEVSKQTDPSGDVTAFSYAPGGSASGASETTTVTTYPQGESGTVPPHVTIDQYASGSLIASDNGAATTTYTRDPATLIPTTVTVSPDAGQSGTARTTHYSLDAIGDFTSTTDPAGNASAAEFTSTGKQYCSVSAGELLADGNNCPSSAPTAPPASGSDPWPGASVTAYNANGQVLSTTDALGNTTAYAYTAEGGSVPAGLQYCSVDAANYAAGVTCPSYAAAIASPPMGATITTFNPHGQAVAQSAPSGGVTTFGYAANGMVTTSTDPLGEVTTMAYDPDDHVTAKSLYATATASTPWSTTASAYDPYGRIYCQISALAYSLGTTSCTPWPSTLSTHPQPGVTSYFYDATGRLTQSTNPIGGTTLSAYDQAGERYCTVSATAYSQGTTSCPAPTASWAPGTTWTTFDAAGRVATTTNPLGSVTTNVDDGFGDITTQSVASNDGVNDPTVTTVKVYDPDGRVTSSTVDPSTPLAETTLSTYDPNGDAFCQVSPNAVAKGVSTSDCPTWQPSWINSPPSAGSLYVVPPAAPTSSQAQEVSTSFANDNGVVVQKSDAGGSTTVSVPDSLGRTSCSISATDLASYLSLSTTTGAAANYPYDCPSTPSVVATPPYAGGGSATGYTVTWHDQAGDVTATTDASGNTTTSTFDPVGNLMSSTNPNGELTLDCYYYESCAGTASANGDVGPPSARYFEESPPTQQSGSGKLTFTGYLPGGTVRSTQASGPSNTTTYAYDANGDVIQEAFSNPGAGFTPEPTPTTYSYNPDGTRSKMTDGTGTTTIAYNAIGEVTDNTFPSTASGTTSTGYTYFTTGQKATMTNPGVSFFAGPVVTYTYDATGAMSSEAIGAGSTPVQFSHDADGNTTSTVDPNGDTVSKTYDLGGGETSTSLAPTATPSSTVLSYSTPRAAGELVASETDTGAGTNPETLAYSYTPDTQLGKVNSSSATYDPANQLTQASGQSYVQCFDAAGELTATKVGTCATGVTTSSLTYDSAGNRLSESPTSNGITGMAPAGQTPASPGSQTFNQAGELTSETPAPVTSGGAPTTSTYVPVTPSRVCDTRPGNPSGLTGTASANCNGKTLPSGGPITVQLSGTSMPAPATATGVVLAITGFNSGSSPTSVTITPYGSSGGTTTTNLSVPAEQTATSQVTVGTGPDAGAAAVTLTSSDSATTDVTVDVVGYFVAGSAGAAYTWIPAKRICDTLGSSGLSAPYNQCNKTVSNKPIGAGGTLTVTAASSKMPVPLGATAVVADVTAVAPTTSTSLTVYADGSARPATQMLSAPPGTTTTQEVTIPISTSTGAFDVYNASGSVNVTIDVVGYYNAGTLNQFAPVTPGRICDTQSTESGSLNGSAAQCTGQTLSSGSTLKFQARSLATIPARATGVVLSVTAVPLNSTDSGSLTIYAVSGSEPSTTSLSFSSGASVTSEETVPISPSTSAATGIVDVAAHGAGVNVRVDVVGYYLATGASQGESYTYNGDELRMVKSSNGTNVQFAYDTTQPNTPVISDMYNWYVYGPAGELVASVTWMNGGSTTYAVTDQLGSVRALMNSSGTVIGTQNYDALGNVSSAFGSMSPIGFAGADTDASTGYLYLNHRYYDPATGVFLSVDPLVDKTQQPYAYTGNDPLNATDPSGQCTSGSWWCDALHSAGAGLTGVDQCLNNPACFSGGGLQNAADGFVNAAGRTAGGLLCSASNGQICPDWGVGAATCAPPGSYQYGEALFFGVGLLIPGGDESDAASAVERGASFSESASGETVRAIVTSLPRGSNSGVYVVQNEGQIESLFQLLSEGGKPVSNSFNGPFVMLPDGTTVGLRPSKPFGPTIYLKTPGTPQIKVHIANS